MKTEIEIRNRFRLIKCSNGLVGTYDMNSNLLIVTNNERQFTYITPTLKEAVSCIESLKL